MAAGPQTPSVLLVAIALFGCVGGSGASASTASTPVTLDGEVLLHRTCTVCHDLGGLPAFADYWGEPEWQSMVETMMEYGAKLAPEEVPILVRYLAVNYGTGRDGKP